MPMTNHRLSNPCSLRWSKSARKPEPPSRSSGILRIADLFCGCGGLSLGVFEACRELRIDVETAMAVDVDEDALQVYRKNFGSSCRRADCTSIESLFQGRLSMPLSERELALRTAIGQINLLVAGPPCQGHSDLNNHSRRLDRRNALYARVARAAQVLTPAVVIIENVIGIVNDRGHVLSRVRNALAAHGYVFESFCIDARTLGIPQKRRRHFLVAFAKASLPLWRPLPKYNGSSWTVGQMLSGLRDEPTVSTSTFRTASMCTKRNQRRIDFLFDNELYDLPDSKRPPCHKDRDHSYKSVYGRLRWDGFANTITSGFGSMGQGRFVHPTRRRMITPHEAARLQGFPDWFCFDEIDSRGSLQAMIGNAVVPRVAAWIVRHLLVTGILEPRMIGAEPIQEPARRTTKRSRATST